MRSTTTTLIQALRTKCGFDLRGEVKDSSDSQLRLLGRVPSGRVGDLLLLIHALKNKEKDGGWHVDISKMYIVKDSRVVYAWRFIFEAPGLHAQLPGVIGIVNAAPKSSRTEVTSMPLIGASANRNEQSPTGKGAGLFGQLRLGSSLKR